MATVEETKTKLRLTAEKYRKDQKDYLEKDDLIEALIAKIIASSYEQVLKDLS